MILRNAIVNHNFLITSIFGSYNSDHISGYQKIVKNSFIQDVEKMTPVRNHDQYHSVSEMIRILYPGRYCFYKHDQDVSHMIYIPVGKMSLTMEYIEKECIVEKIKMNPRDAIFMENPDYHMVEVDQPIFLCISRYFKP
jgi:hypothetical protein